MTGSDGAVPTARRSTGPGRRGLVVGLAVAVVWAAQRAGAEGDVINTRGWSAFTRFWTALGRPELAGGFLVRTVDAAVTTLSFALLGTALSLLIGAAGGLALSELLWEGGRLRWLARVVVVLPRAVHEILWALLLVQVLGFDPLVAVLAIGVPFGAVTARVFADTVDDADPLPYHILRASGAGRLGALAYGVLPTVRADLVSYGFYRLECAIRSAAVLGVIGAGGLGYELDLSFQSLRYGEIWTLVAALMVLSGAADAWSAAVRRRPDGRQRRLVASRSLAALVVALPAAWWWTGIDVTGLWSERTRRLAGDLAVDLLPPRLGPGGWAELVAASVDTVAMSILAITLAAGGGLVAASLVARPGGSAPATGGGRLGSGGAGAAGPDLWPARRRDLLRTTIRLALLLLRAVPAPIWAFVVVLVLFPGPWPGAVALGLYNLGVLGRLYAETLEDGDPRPARLLGATGATAVQRLAYARLPLALPRLTSLSLYRWEVVLRETVVVGVVGAGGLGRLAQGHLAARDFAAVAGVVGGLVVLSVMIDALSSGLRRVLRADTAARPGR